MIAAKASSRRVGPLAFALIPLIVAVAGFALARIALLPGVGLWDTAELQVVGPLIGTAHPTGYPTYVLLAWLASIVLQPLGEPAFRINLLAALLAGATAGLGAHLVRRLTGRVLLGAAGGLAVATLPVVWRLGTHADVHGLHGAFVALLLVLLVEWESRSTSPTRDRWLLAAAVAAGLSLGNQGLTVLLIPGSLLFVVAVDPAIVRRPRFLGACVVAGILPAALVYLELPLRAGLLRAPLVYGHPDTLVGFLYVVSGAQFASTFDSAGIVARVGEAAGRLVDQLGLLAVLTPIAALVVAARRPTYALLTIPAFLLTAWFATGYVNAEIDRYWLGPALIAVTWLAVAAGAIADALDSRTRRRAGPVLVEVLGCLLLLAPVLVGPAERFAAVDRSHDDSAARWLDATFASLPPNAVVVSWWDYSMPMWYGQLVERRRPDLVIVDDRTRLDQGLGSVDDVLDSYLGRRPVFIIRLPADMPALEARYELASATYTDHSPIEVLRRRAVSP